MKIHTSILTTLIFLTPLLSFAEDPTPKQEVSVYYFGNSLTGVTQPDWHERLGASAGKKWQDSAWLGAGWQLWQHREELTAGKDIFGGGSKGDLTLDDNLIKGAPFHAKKLFGQKWDAAVFQLFGQYVSHETDEMWGKKLASKKDVGDLQSASDLMRVFLKLNPQGTCYIYQVWPPMDPGKIPPADQLPDWARKPGARMAAAEFPLRDTFDYPARWLQKYDPANDKPWINSSNRSQDFGYQVFRGLQERFPELWVQGRLRMIPTGDLFLELDKQMKAGKIPGCKDIRDFYTDVQHIRFGLARYTAAAMFYACIFQQNPDTLDWKIYNDRESYGEDKYHDGGELLPITEENAKAVNSVIWEFVSNHSFTRIKK